MISPASSDARPPILTVTLTSPWSLQGPSAAVERALYRLTLAQLVQLSVA